MIIIFIHKFQLKTIFSRILFFNILLVLIITVIPLSIYSNYFKRNYDKEINNYNMQLVKQFQTYVDEQLLEKVINIPNIYLSNTSGNSDLTYPLTEDISTDSTRIYNIREKLADIISKYNFIDTIELYYSKSDLFLSENGVQFLKDISSEKASDYQWIRKLKAEEQNTVWIPSRITQNGIERNTSVFIRSIPYFSDKSQRQAVMAIGIKEESINSFFYKSGNYGDQLLFIVDENGSIVASNEKDISNSIIKESGIINKLFNNSSSGMLQDKVAGKMNAISFVKSNYNNWRYVSLTPVSNLYERSNKLISIIGILGITTLFLSLYVSFMFTKKAYRPLGEIIKTAGSISRTISADKSIMENDEYKLLSNTINTLAFKVTDLNNKLQSNMPIIRHNTILKLLNGKIGLSKINEDKLYDIRFEGDKIFTFTIKIYRDKNLSFEHDLLINYNLIEILENLTKDFSIYGIMDDNNFVSGLVNFHSSTPINVIIENMTSAIEELLKTKFILCLGSIMQIEDTAVAISYNEACVALSHSFFETTEKVLMYENLSTAYVNDELNLSKLFEKLQEAIKTSDETKLLFAIDSTIEALKNINYSISYRKNTLSDIIFMIHTAASVVNIDTSELIGYDLREYFNSIDDIDEFSAWIKKVCEILICSINKKQCTYKDFSIRIKKYIEDNIFNDLSLETVADNLKISSYYLSRIFKASSGNSFSSYVTEIKLQKATELLKEGNLSVKEISSKLGYNSVQHFIKIFKEKYFSTPKEYQKEFHNNLLKQ